MEDSISIFYFFLMLSLSMTETVYVLDREGIETLVEILLSLSSITISTMKTM
jgi:hypothetical protein